MKIKAIDPQGIQKESQVPPSASPALVEQMIRQLQGANYTDIELIGEQGKITDERFISLDEQRAAMSAIEAERHQGPLCPDCGREMVQDGGYLYCEYCEG